MKSKNITTQGEALHHYKRYGFYEKRWSHEREVPSSFACNLLQDSDYWHPLQLAHCQHSSSIIMHHHVKFLIRNITMILIMKMDIKGEVIDNILPLLIGSGVLCDIYVLTIEWPDKSIMEVIHGIDWKSS